MKEKLVCAFCGENLTEETLKEFDDKVMCEHCFDEKTTVCDNCGDRIWRDDAEGDSTCVLCSHCREYSYTTCDECGRLIHNDDARYEDDDYPYCIECYQRHQDCSIKNYGYKPEPVFHGSGNLFYGIELEIDKGGEYEDNAQAILNVGNRDGEHIYCKHDGSIENGFEIVSHPMSLDYHINCMNWKDVFEKAISLGYYSHNTMTCGYHIHCSRQAFGDSYEKQEKAIGRVVYFVEKHWNELVKFSRRKTENLQRWAARYATISNTTDETYKKAKDRHMGRYVAVNLEPLNSIEFRLFRGTLREETFLATLQLVDEICYYAINLSDREMEELSWSEFVSRILPKKAELIEYLKSKRLYVNELEMEDE